MAGHVIGQYLHVKGYNVWGVARKIHKPMNWPTITMDISDIGELRKLIAHQGFNVVVNAVGALIEESDTKFPHALWLNGEFPNILASWSKELGFKLILISTDCVFDGMRGAYQDTDVPNANDNYGLSKRIGEVSDQLNVLTIRTSIIGQELKNGSGLWNWFQNQQHQVFGFKRVFWSGITTFELAKAVGIYLKDDISGLIHLTNGIPICKYDLLTLLNDQLGLNMNIIPHSAKYSNKSLIPSRKLLYTVPAYGDMIAEQIEFYQHEFG